MPDKRWETAKKGLWAVSILLLVLFPLRHALKGVDLWDGGYNYANFRYMGTEYMDSMWLFATWLANAFGAFFTRLPFGNTMAGMNVYTGLVPGLLAAAAYVFCVKKLRVPAWIAFMGGLLALCLCWLPTASLYNYLTYVLLFAGTAFLYLGLAGDKRCYLIAAGAALGLNVGVRFSNLAQAGLIVAVWAYGILRRKKAGKVLRETGWCILGYAAAFGLFLLLMTVLYGFDEYVSGIRRLFGMTEHAKDYTVGAMLEGMVWYYFQGAYWLKRFLLAAVGGLLVCVALPAKWVRAKRALCVLFFLPVAWWLERSGFYSNDRATYSAVLYPCVILLTMTVGLCLFWIVDRKTPGEEKLLAGLVVLTVLTASLGGNNAVYSTINNLFLVLPCSFWMIWKFCRERKHILYFPVKCALLLAVFFMTVQGLRFGAGFVYEEAAGGRNLTAEVSGVPALEGMRTGKEKAAGLSELYAYIRGAGLQDRECLLYGQIPGVSYYMELAPAMNIWADLRSYGYETMQRDVGELEKEMAEGGRKPIVILAASHAGYVEDRNAEGLFQEETAEWKMGLVCDFMEKYNYEKTFENGGFAVFQ